MNQELCAVAPSQAEWKIDLPRSRIDRFGNLANRMLKDAGFDAVHLDYSKVVGAGDDAHDDIVVKVTVVSESSRTGGRSRTARPSARSTRSSRSSPASCTWSATTRWRRNRDAHRPRSDRAR